MPQAAALSFTHNARPAAWPWFHRYSISNSATHSHSQSVRKLALGKIHIFQKIFNSGLLRLPSSHTQFLISIYFYMENLTANLFAVVFFQDQEPLFCFALLSVIGFWTALMLGSCRLCSSSYGCIMRDGEAFLFLKMTDFRHREVKQHVQLQPARHWTRFATQMLMTKLEALQYTIISYKETKIESNNSSDHFRLRWWMCNHQFFLTIIDSLIWVSGLLFGQDILCV